MREYRYTVDRDGRFFHDDTEIVDPAVLRFFLLAMQMTADGRYLVVCQGEHNWFESADTPFVVQRLRCTVDADRLVAVELFLAGDHHEPLDPSTLQSDGGLLFCRVRRRAYRARFGRVAVQQLAPYLCESDAGETSLTMNGASFAIDSRGDIATT